MRCHTAGKVIMEREEEDDWGSDAEVVDFDDDDKELSYTIPELQPRICSVSKARWNDDMGMAEVVEKKGKMWTTTGIIRNGKTYSLIEETLFLVEIGALLVMDNNNDMCLPLKDLYLKVGETKSGCCWELFKIYRHLKSLGYIVGRHKVPWSTKSVKGNSVSGSSQGILENGGLCIEVKDDTASIVERFSNLQMDEVGLVFDVYLPDSKFRKTAPGDPAFMVCLIRGPPPSYAEIESLESQCDGIPLKVCHVEHGRVTFFSFRMIELPTLP